MKIDRITYSESIEVMEKKWIKTGAEGQLTDDEDPAQAMADLKIFVREAIKKDYEDLQLLKNHWNPNWDHHLPSKELPVIDRSIESVPVSMESEISSCQSLKVLESYKFIVRSKPDLQNIYDQKLAELSK